MAVNGTASVLAAVLPAIRRRVSNAAAMVWTIGVKTIGTMTALRRVTSVKAKEAGCVVLHQRNGARRIRWKGATRLTAVRLNGFVWRGSRHEDARPTEENARAR